MALPCSPDIFRNALDHIPDAVLISDGTGAVRFANRHAPHLLGYAIEELLGRDLEGLVPERFRGIHIARTDLLAAAEDRPPGSARPLAACRKDGSKFPVQITLGSIEDAQGVFLVATIRDITAYQDLSRELSLARAAAAHAERTAQQARDALAVARCANAARWTSAGYLLRQQLQALSILNGLLGRAGQPDDVTLTHALSSQAEAIVAMMNLLDPLDGPSELDSSSVTEKAQTPAPVVTRLIESLTLRQPTSCAAAAAHADHTVLIVLRDWAMREAAAGLLRISGYDVLTARNGEEALAIARLHPQLGYVLTEQVLGGSETGAAVIDALRSRLGANLKTILISDDPVIARANGFESTDPTLIARMPVRAEELLRMMDDLRHDALPRSAIAPDAGDGHAR